MIVCPSCSAEQSEASKFCAECGVALDYAIAATATHIEKPPSSHTSERGPASSSSHHGRFLPGTTIANRYRIVSLAGKGGMGEVYRADDLKLGHTVALKFLPKDLSTDQRRMDLFLSEVRLTRQISHPNVCRVYDIGEVNGQHFLSMEYIDGEDLRILLRRIGRLPKDKGVQIAQQLCSGLAAAHDRGVLHRDLKPANVMLDGQGQVRITDFGLAKLANDGAPGEVVGTPAYMAPEQLLSGETSRQSDLYALGLVLAEVFLGKPINHTNDVAQLVARYRSSGSSVESLNSPDIDPIVEQAILSCLARDPDERPRTARQLANALPGGDPLEAVLAAGMTPSPELVVNATDKHLLRFPVAVVLLAITFSCLGLSAYLNRNTRMMETPPEVLSAKCDQIMQTLGYAELPVNTAVGAEPNAGIQKELKEKARDQAWLDGQKQPKFRFWRRWTDGIFMSREFHIAYVLSRDTPILDNKQEFTVVVDDRGHLIELKVIAEHPAVASAISTDFDWNTLLELAGIDENDAEEIAPVSAPPMFCDQRKAWVVSKGTEAEQQIQAGAVGGRVTYFEIVGLNEAMHPPNQHDQSHLFGSILFNVVWLFALFVAWLNTRASRADWKNALRVATFVLLLYFFQELVALQPRSPDFSASIFGLFQDRAWAHVLSHAFEVAVLYVAIEPYIRRFWPRSMVGMTRILGGRWHDPTVGKELLAGVAAGYVLYVLRSSLTLAFEGQASQITLFALTPFTIGLSVWSAGIAHTLSSGFLSTIGNAALCVLPRLVFRRIRYEFLMVAIAVLFATGLTLSRPAGTPIYTGIDTFCLILFVPLVLSRIGLLALYIAIFTCVAAANFPPLHPDSWYVSYAIGPLLIVAAIALFGFATSQGGLAKLIQFFEKPDSVQ